MAVRRKTLPTGDALAIREVHPAEEFAGFENFGEFPEWHPGQAESAKDPELQIEASDDRAPSTPGSSI
jgi:hypothetical protein